MEPAEFGRYLEKQRKARNLTQQQLADLLHVSSSAVSKWERGLCLPEISKFEDIAEVLDVSLLELIRCGKVTEKTVIPEASKSVSDVIKISVHQEREKIIRAVLAVLIVIAVIAGIRIGYMYALKPVKINYGESEIHSRTDLDIAIDIVKFDFKTGNENCKLLKLSYAGDEKSQRTLEQYNGYQGNSFTDCIVLESEFLPPLSLGGAWGGFHVYKWNFIVVKNQDGSWRLLTKGYE